MKKEKCGCEEESRGGHDDDGQASLFVAEEVGLAIFAHLAPLDLLRSAAPVCRRFHRWAHDPALWRGLLAHQLFIAPSWASSQLHLMPSLPFSYADLRSSSIPAPSCTSPPATFEEWWCRLEALRRHTHELQRLLLQAAPNPTFFRLHADFYFLPPTLAPLACLTSSTCSTASPSPSPSSPSSSSSNLSLFPLYSTSALPPPPPAPSSSTSSPTLHHLEDVLAALAFDAPQLQRFRDASTMASWFKLQLSVRIHGGRSVGSVEAALRNVLPRPPSSAATLTDRSSPDGERERSLHALYHVQKKHATASGVLILHHDINALVLIRIGDYD